MNKNNFNLIVALLIILIIEVGFAIFCEIEIRSRQKENTNQIIGIATTTSAINADCWAE